MSSAMASNIATSVLLSKANKLNPEEDEQDEFAQPQELDAFYIDSE